MEKNKNKNALTRFFSDPYLGQSQVERQTQKRVFTTLVIVCFVALGFGAWHIRNQLVFPFTPKTDTNAETALEAQVIASGIDALRDQDTDSDGLNDYDEIYIVKTSPYIADSDSDGIPDKEEYNQGTDPNCPEGENCNRTIIADDNTNQEILTELQPDDGPTDVTTDPDNITADELRQILRDAGASEEDLSQISDEDLLQTYQEIQADRGADTTTETTDTNTAAATNTESDTADPSVTLDALSNFNADEIRQFLIDSGVPEDTLAEIDDDTLQAIFAESLDQYATENNLAL